MVEKLPLVTLLPAIKALVRLFEASGAPGLILGGVAASFHGESRLTKDVDGMIWAESLSFVKILELAATVGLVPRNPHPEAFARQYKILLLVHPASGVTVDLSLGLTPFEKESVERSQTIHDADLNFQIPSPEDLIIYKAIANRAQDRIDIEKILKVHPDLDRARIIKWIKDFAQTLEIPELVSSIQQLLEAGKTQPKQTVKRLQRSSRKKR